MKLQRAYKTELDLNNRQRTLCLQHAGCARFVYNWALEQREAARAAGEKMPSVFDLQKRLTAIKATEFPWLYGVSSCVSGGAIRALDAAFANFFRKCKAKNGKPGYPRFKSKRRGIGSFKAKGDRVKVFENAVQLPRLGKLRLKESGYLPTEGVRILSATVSEQAGHWFVSIQVEQEIAEPETDENKPVVGVDLGIKTLATCSDGTIFENPRALKSNLKKLRRASRTVSRRVKGSANRKKAVRKMARLHYRISNIRKDTLHKITSILTRENQTVVIEDLNVSGMLKNHKLAQAISDVGFAEFRRQLAYKAAWRGCRIIVASRWMPSSKTCSACGVVKETLSLSERTFKCECGFVCDRDLNAAKNLEKLSVGSTAETPVEKLAMAPSQDSVKLIPMKQELNSNALISVW